MFKVWLIDWNDVYIYVFGVFFIYLLPVSAVTIQ